MRAFLDDLAAVEDVYPVGLFHRAQTMGDLSAGPAYGKQVYAVTVEEFELARGPCPLAFRKNVPRWTKPLTAFAVPGRAEQRQASSRYRPDNLLAERAVAVLVFLAGAARAERVPRHLAPA